MLRILLDMDGVLVDFVTAAAAIHGLQLDQVKEHWTPGTWSMVEPIGLARDPYKRFTVDDFWAPIHAAGSAFWEGLEPLSWMNELIHLVEKTGAEWHVVSAPSLCPTSYDGKVKWLKRQFGAEFNRFILTPHKELFAKPNHLLIDDRASNISRFLFEGGEGILFPAYCNGLHHLEHNPIPYIAQNLEKSPK